jgi:hypothetical protein
LLLERLHAVQDAPVKPGVLLTFLILSRCLGAENPQFPYRTGFRATNQSSISNPSRERYPSEGGTPVFIPVGGIVGPENIQISAANASEIRYQIQDESNGTNKRLVVGKGETVRFSLVPALKPRRVVIRAEALKNGAPGTVARATYWVAPKPANDDRSNAYSLSGSSGLVFGNTRGSTAEPAETNQWVLPTPRAQNDDRAVRRTNTAPAQMRNAFGGTTQTQTVREIVQPDYSKSVWFEWIAPKTGDFRFEVETYDEGTSLLSVLDGASETLLGSVTSILSDSKTKMVSFAATAQRKYLIRVASPEHNGSGSFRIIWREAAGTPPAPTLSPAAGAFGYPVPVTMRSSVVGAKIRYTFDGSDPDPRGGSLIYDPEQPPVLEMNTTIKARVFVTGWTPSPITSVTYKVTLPTIWPKEPPAPKFEPRDGHTFSTDWLSVSMYSPIQDVVIRYTLDGNHPTEDDQIVPPDGIQITNTVKIKARIWKANAIPTLPVEAMFAKAEADSDLDGLPDSWEVAHASDPFRPNAEDECRVPLGFGLPNWQIFLNPEILLASDVEFSSAKDGIPDWWKIKYNLDCGAKIATKKDRTGATILQRFQSQTDPVF